MRDDGTVKVLDFGLAKLLETETVASPLTMSPTLSLRGTYTGVILGTAAYMSPEQARGRRVDRRTDIWAFGCVLYEMLTGTRAFEAEDVAETVAAVLTRDPPLDRVPPQARRLVERCLQRDPRQRLRDVGDAMLLLADTEDERGPEVARSANRWPLLLAGAVATMAIGVGAGAMYGRQSWASVRRTDVQLTIVAGDRISLRPVGSFNATPVISPDGSDVAVIAQDGLRWRLLSGFEMSPVPGGEFCIPRAPAVRPRS